MERNIIQQIDKSQGIKSPLLLSNPKGYFKIATMFTEQEIENLAQHAYPINVEIINGEPIDTKYKEREAFKFGIITALSVKK